MDGGGGFNDGDFGGEGGGTGIGTWILDIVGVKVRASGGRRGWTIGGNLCCISILMLKRTESLKDLSKASNMFLINKFVSMRSTRNYFSIVSSRLAY